MKKILIILLLTIATVLPTFATNWVEVGEKLYIDIDTIEPYVDDFGYTKPNQYSYWVKILNNGSQGWRKDEKLLNKKIWYMMCKEIIDINRKVDAMKFYTYYDLNGRPICGKEVDSILMEWQSIIPNTVGDTKYRIIKEYVNSN